MHLSTSITTRLEYQHKSLMDIIDGLSDEQIRRPVVIGKWSIFENIVHLATYQHAFIDRLKQILETEQPQFPRYTAETDPLFYDNCSRSTREIMQDLITTRRELNVKILALGEQQVRRTGIHPLFGSLNITQWLNFFVLHEAHHLFTVFKLVPGARKELN
ncbi:MAG TPA: DinB family protein [Chitinophagaceae bacterium]|nr:DinB family protein [Chitinophagaceae bacterium]